MRAAGNIKINQSTFSFQLPPGYCYICALLLHSFSFKIQMDKGIKVCVTGGSGYIASYLINNLLQRGYTVHATLRTLSDEKKVGLLKGLPHADTRLKLFEADIYKSEEFEAAIQGCSFVFHLATPFQHHEGNSQYKNTVEASVGGVRTIVESCIRSKTVKKIIYTATVTAAAPLKEDGSGFRDVIDENYWTPLNLPSASGSILYEYLKSKTLAEKEVLSYNGKGIEVVTLPLSMVAGDTVQSSMSGSMSVLICQAVKDEYGYKALKELQDMTVKIPVVHVQDVVDAHIFSMEHPHMNGRFLVATAFLKSAELAALLQKYLPDITIPPEFIEDKDIDVKWGSTKLQDSGFQYKFDADKIVQDTIACAKRFGKI